MATKLSKFPVAPGQGRHDWDQLLDGSPWELFAGADFSGELTTFASKVRLQATKRGGRVRIRRFTGTKTERLVLQFLAGR